MKNAFNKKNFFLHVAIFFGVHKRSEFATKKMYKINVKYDIISQVKKVYSRMREKKLSGPYFIGTET